MLDARAKPSPAAPPTSDALAPLSAKELALTEVGYEAKGGIATVTLNRPKAYNAYSANALRELARAFTNASFDDAVGVIVLTGAGDRAFCTGGDVKEYAGRYVQRPHDYWKYMGFFNGAIESILRAGKPVVARLNGITVGGGNELHLACDLSVAAEHIYLGQVGVGVGSVACGGATQWLPITVGDRRARAMLMLNERIPARKALEWGLVNEVAPSVAQGGKFVENPTPEQVEKAQRVEDGYRIDLGKLDASVDKIAQRLLGMFPECLRYTRAQTSFWKELAWHNTSTHARDWLALHYTSLEPYEGMTAFVEKRPARIRELRESMAAGGSSDWVHGPPSKRCGKCGAGGLPADFAFCGNCGGKL